MAPASRVPYVALLVMFALQLMFLTHLKVDLSAQLADNISQGRTIADAAVSKLRTSFVAVAEQQKKTNDLLQQRAATVENPEQKLLYRMTVFVFTYNRLAGLQRLVKSLVESEYLGHRVDLSLFIDNPKKTPDKEAASLSSSGESTDTPIMQWVRKELVWPHGELRVHRREKNAGLKRSIMEAWYPMREDQFGAFFEDDTEVSPLWYRWVDTALRRYYFVSDRSPRLIGLSLYRPIHDELNSRAIHMDNGNEPFVFQSPCSWGAVYFPGPWRHFRDWFPTVNFDPKLPWSTPSNSWFWWDSWKKFLIRLMWDHGLHMVYVHLPDNEVLSTNHLMKGMHNLPPRDKFELPLLTRERYEHQLAQGRDLLQCPPLSGLKVLDMQLKEHPSPHTLPGASADYQLTL
eukprot:GGOE01041063.1.p1 GENE.GGOE01041063.1~~GGOE01041063.1.p1  ORF type:complete len:425 (+),score=132.98 GGOE01041063.1:72-1277(+)